jgi:hypothetical protein
MNDSARTVALLRALLPDYQPVHQQPAHQLVPAASAGAPYADGF